MDGQNSHDVHLCVYPQHPSSSFASSTLWPTKGIIHFPCDYELTLLTERKILTCSHSPAVGSRRRGRISHRRLLLPGCPPPACTASHVAKVTTKQPVIERKSTVDDKKSPQLGSLPSDPGVWTWLCWSLVDYDEFPNSWGTQKSPKYKKPSLALWSEKKNVATPRL